MTSVYFFSKSMPPSEQKCTLKYLWPNKWVIIKWPVFFTVIIYSIIIHLLFWMIKVTLHWFINYYINIIQKFFESSLSFKSTSGFDRRNVEWDKVIRSFRTSVPLHTSSYPSIVPWFMWFTFQDLVMVLGFRLSPRLSFLELGIWNQAGTNRIYNQECFSYCSLY